ncbi:MAG: sugar ABC transporter permease [bacterium]|nr:sugar ABC transporter permease [bacterium]
MKHFARLLYDPVIGKAFYHNFLYIFFTIFLEAGVGLVLAAIMIRLKRSVLLRSLIFSPVILPSIVVGVLWQQIYSKEAGLLNAFLNSLGIESITWLGVPYTIFSVSIVSGWIWAGFFMAIFYAGFVRIPQSIRESAKLDGATERQIFFKIEIPLIRNLILMAFLIVTTGGFKSFDLFKILLRRDPLESGIIVPTLLVRTFFENRDIGYGSVISIVLTVVVLIILFAIRILQKKVVGDIEEY